MLLFVLAQSGAEAGKSGKQSNQVQGKRMTRGVSAGVHGLLAYRRRSSPFNQLLTRHFILFLCARDLPMLELNHEFADLLFCSGHLSLPRLLFLGPSLMACMAWALSRVCVCPFSLKKCMPLDTSRLRNMFAPQSNGIIIESHFLCPCRTT